MSEQELNMVEQGVTLSEKVCGNAGKKRRLYRGVTKFVCSMCGGQTANKKKVCVGCLNHPPIVPRIKFRRDFRR